MIYCEDKFNEKYIISDNFKVKGSLNSGIKIIETLIEALEPFKPENGSPTLALIEKLKQNNFKILDSELPIIEQAEDVVY